jgi:hypothetical protein
MSATATVLEPLFGLLELDAAGTVLYYNSERDTSVEAQTRDIVGRNLFADITPAPDAGELERQIGNFRRSESPSRSLNFTFHYDRGDVHARILLARIRERSEQGGRESMLVHIRRAF